MRNVPLVERRTRSGVPHESSVLRQGRQFQFDMHGEVERPGFRGNHLPKVDTVGKNLKEKEVCDGMEIRCG